MGFFDLFSSRRRKKRSRPKFSTQLLLANQNYYIKSVRAIRHLNYIFNIKLDPDVRLCLTYIQYTNNIRIGLLDWYYQFNLYAVALDKDEYRLDTDHILSRRGDLVKSFYLTSTEVAEYIQPFPTTAMPSLDIIRSLEDLYTVGGSQGVNFI
jgi:hypothetical protein